VGSTYQLLLVSRHTFTTSGLEEVI